MLRIIRDITKGNVPKCRFSDYRVPTDEYWSTKLSSYERWKSIDATLFPEIPPEIFKNKKGKQK